ADGHSLIVFPEGTRSLDGAVARFKGGSFVIALDAGLPIVPISVVGSREVMLKGQLMVRPGEVSLVVHDPIETAGIERDAARDLAVRVHDIVAAAAGEPPAGWPPCAMFAAGPALTVDLTAVPLFKGLSDAERHAVVSSAHRVTRDGGAHFFEQGASADAFYVLVEGRVKVTQITAEGHQVVLRLVAPGSPFGGVAAFG